MREDLDAPIPTVDNRETPRAFPGWASTAPGELFGVNRDAVPVRLRDFLPPVPWRDRLEHVWFLVREIWATLRGWR